MKRVLAVLISALVIVPGIQLHLGAQLGPTLAPEIAQRVDALFAPWNNTHSPGCALGVSRNGNLVYARGYGMSNLEYDVPITPNSIFGTGSIAKQFTAFSIGLLARDGKLALDDDVHRYLPELPDYGHRITIRHLLTHTSGLRDAYNLLGLAGWRMGQGRFEASPLQEPITEEDVLRMAARQQTLDFSPGAEYAYSNSGYTLLAIIVKRISGQSLSAFAGARIFAPLGMRDTQFLDDPKRLVRRRASAYQSGTAGEWRIHVPSSPVTGPTGLYTTVGDLLKWEENFVDIRVGGRALLDEMQTSGQLSDGRTTGYGFGLNLLTYRGVRRVGHGGSDFAYLAEAYRFPEHHLAIAILCNVDTVPILVPRLAEILLGDTLEPITRPAPAVLVPEGELTALAGTYWSPIQITRVVMKEGGLATTGGEALTPIGGGRFRVGNRQDNLLFPPATPGGPQELHVLAATGTIVLSRVRPHAYSVTELKAFAGKYRSDELDATYTMAVMPEGVLALLRDKVDPLPLTAFSADTFLFRESLADAVKFVRAPSGEVTGFAITGRTPRLLAFTRVGVASSTSK